MRLSGCKYKILPQLLLAYAMVAIAIDNYSQAYLLLKKELKKKQLLWREEQKLNEEV